MKTTLKNPNQESNDGSLLEVTLKQLPRGNTKIIACYGYSGKHTQQHTIISDHQLFVPDLIKLLEMKESGIVRIECDLDGEDYIEFYLKDNNKMYITGGTYTKDTLTMTLPVEEVHEWLTPHLI